MRFILLLLKIPEKFLYSDIALYPASDFEIIEETVANMNAMKYYLMSGSRTGEAQVFYSFLSYYETHGLRVFF